MSADSHENIYWRASLAEFCTSGDLWNSVQQGRVAPDERFVLDDEVLTIAQIEARDPIFRKPPEPEGESLPSAAQLAKELAIARRRLAQLEHVREDASVTLAAVIAVLRTTDFPLERKPPIWGGRLSSVAAVLEEAQKTLTQSQDGDPVEATVCNGLRRLEECRRMLVEEMQAEYERWERYEKDFTRRIEADREKAIQELRRQSAALTVQTDRVERCRAMLQRIIGQEVPFWKRHLAIWGYAPEIAPADIFALYDDTLLRLGTRGLLVTADMLYGRGLDKQQISFPFRARNDYSLCWRWSSRFPFLRKVFVSENEVLLEFGPFCGAGLRRFCDALNHLVSRSTPVANAEELIPKRKVKSRRKPEVLQHWQEWQSLASGLASLSREDERVTRWLGGQWQSFGGRFREMRWWKRLRRLWRLSPLIRGIRRWIRTCKKAVKRRSRKRAGN